jgi:hypothetical protein
MWLTTSGYGSECAKVHDALEGISSGEQSEGVLELGVLLAELSEEVRAHVNGCDDCRVFAAELLEVRGMFQYADTGPQPGPYFLARVMAAISDREGELERISQTWAAVPRLAYRLSVLASLSLLVAAGWLYQQPRHDSVTSTSAAQNTEGLVDGSGNTVQDDFLLNTADR